MKKKILGLQVMRFQWQDLPWDNLFLVYLKEVLLRIQNTGCHREDLFGTQWLVQFMQVAK